MFLFINLRYRTFHRQKQDRMSPSLVPRTLGPTIKIRNIYRCFGDTP